MDKYFSAANTSLGFINYFKYAICEDNMSQILYIKGGSGIGKSTFMKKIAKRAQELHRDVTYIHCSSDPDSLDGIISNDIAVFDATMPHISDPLYPRINGKIVDLGMYLDSSKLLPYRQNIIDLVRDKKEHYNRLYALLAPLNEVVTSMSALLNVDKNYIHTMIEDIIDDIGNSHGNDRRGFLRAISSDGIVNYTNDMKVNRQSIGILCRCPHVVNSIITTIAHRMDASGNMVDKYYSLCTPKLIETLATNDYIISHDTTLSHDIIYNIDNIVNIKNEHAYNILNTFYDDIISEAQNEISHAKSAHLEIEKIYQNAANFNLIDNAETKLIDELFS